MTADHERMQAWADAARGHPTWSVAYAEDVPKLLAELKNLQGIQAHIEDPWHRLRKAESDLTLCRDEAARLRLWLDLIANDDGEGAHLYRTWAGQALEGEKP